jgi:hypothetical protein
MAANQHCNSFLQWVPLQSHSVSFRGAGSTIDQKLAKGCILKQLSSVWYEGEVVPVFNEDIDLSTRWGEWSASHPSRSIPWGKCSEKHLLPLPGIKSQPFSSQFITMLTELSCVKISISNVMSVIRKKKVAHAGGMIFPYKHNKVYKLYAATEVLLLHYLNGHTSLGRANCLRYLRQDTRWPRL